MGTTVDGGAKPPATKTKAPTTERTKSPTSSPAKPAPTRPTGRGDAPTRDARTGAKTRPAVPTKPRPSTVTTTERPGTTTAAKRPASNPSPTKSVKPTPPKPPASDTTGKKPTQEQAPPPTAGGERNARTNATAPGTSAAELDAQVPPEQRQQVATQGQAEADRIAAEARRNARVVGENPTELERGALDSYYEQHPTYVDPENGRVYAADYDATTGNLTLTRNDDQRPATDVPEVAEEPVAPRSTVDDDYVPDPQPDRDGGDKDAKRQQKEKELEAGSGRRGPGATPTPTSAEDEHSTHEAPAATHSHDDAGGEGKPPVLGPVAPVPLVADEVIVIAPDGSRTTTTNYANATAPAAGGEDFAASVTTEARGDGHVTAREVETERTRREDGGTVVERASSRTEGDENTSRWSEERRDPNGDSTTRTTTRESTRGTVTSDHRSTVAEAGGVRLSESAYTEYESGRPKETTLVRTASVDGAGRSSRYELGYDEQGFATSIEPAPEGGREPLDAWVTERIGALGPNESRPAFGLVSAGGESEYEGRTVHNPVYVAELGVRTKVDGVDVFIEGDSIAASESLPRSVRALRDSWAGMPPSMQGAARTIDLLEGRSNGDRANSNKFQSEFHAGASAGGTHMTYWLDSDPGANTTRHEYGHLSGGNGGAPDEGAWDEAMEADQATGLRERLGAADDEDIQLVDGMDPLLTDELGASSYAEKHLSENGNENDDWAESIMFYLASRENGGLVQERQADGTIRTYTFEDLYPNRARILDAYYELGPAPDVPAPEWQEPRTGPGVGNFGIFGSAVGGATQVPGRRVPGTPPKVAAGN